MDHDSQAGPKSAAGLAFGRFKDLLHLEFETHDRGFKGALSNWKLKRKRPPSAGSSAHQQCSLEMRCTSATTALTSSSKRYDEGLSALREAAALVDETGERYFEAEIQPQAASACASRIR